MSSRHHFSMVTIVLMFILAILTGCAYKPSTQQARSDLQKWFDSRWPNAISIVEYHATKEESNDKKYTIYYRAKAKYRKNAAGCVRTCCGEICIDRVINGFRWLSKASHDPNVIQKGDMFEMNGRAVFNKTEKGWIGETFS